MKMLRQCFCAGAGCRAAASAAWASQAADRRGSIGSQDVRHEPGRVNRRHFEGRQGSWPGWRLGRASAHTSTLLAMLTPSAHIAIMLSQGVLLILKEKQQKCHFALTAGLDHPVIVNQHNTPRRHFSLPIAKLSNSRPVGFVKLCHWHSPLLFHFPTNDGVLWKLALSKPLPSSFASDMFTINPPVFGHVY